MRFHHLEAKLFLLRYLFSHPHRDKISDSDEHHSTDVRLGGEGFWILLFPSGFFLNPLAFCLLSYSSHRNAKTSSILRMILKAIQSHRKYSTIPPEIFACTRLSQHHSFPQFHLLILFSFERLQNIIQSLPFSRKPEPKEKRNHQ